MLCWLVRLVGIRKCVHRDKIWKLRRATKTVNKYEMRGFVPVVDYSK